MSRESDATTLQMYLGLIESRNRRDLEYVQAVADKKRDDDFTQGLLNQAKEERDIERARADKLAADKKTAGEAYRPSFVANLKRRVSNNLIDDATALTELEDFYTKYGLTPSSDEADSISTTYQGALPKSREAGLTSLYKTTYGRLPTSDELTADQAKMAAGLTIGKIEEELKASSEYKNKNPSSTEEAKLWLQYGKPISDATGASTGTYKQDFGGGTLPELSADIIAKTGISKPDFIGKEITGTPVELERARKSIDNYESYLYNAGLTSLAGTLEKEKDKLGGEIKAGLDKQQIEGQLRVGKQQGQYGLLQGLTGAFNFS